MKKQLKILIVDDHPMIIEAYKNIITSSDALTAKYNFLIETAKDCDSAISKINHSSKSEHYDLIFTDVKLPPSTDNKIISGEGLAIYAKELLPQAKIVVLTMFNESYRIHNILKNANPDGLLVKNDVNSDEFLIAFEKIINNPPYYSTTVTKYFRNQASSSNQVILDDVNRKILFHLSKGVKTKDLVEYVNLSLSAIEKRKTQIKELFGLEKANDSDILKEAQFRGFI